MKTFLVIVALAFTGSSLWAQDFSTHRRPVPPATKQPKTTIVTTRPADGAIQKAVRSGAPLQMLNPFAPKEYGNGAECVYYDENDNFQKTKDAKPKGIRLFAFSW
jgi:hypothetical protein